MKPEGSLPQSQVPATCPYHELARSCPHPHIPLHENPSYQISCSFFVAPKYQPRSETYSLTASQHDTFLWWGDASTSPNRQAGGRSMLYTVKWNEQVTTLNKQTGELLNVYA